MNIRPVSGFSAYNANKSILKNNLRTNFKAVENYDDDEKIIKSQSPDDDIASGHLINTVQGGLLMFSALVGLVTGMGLEKGMDSAYTKQKLENFEKVVNDPEIKKDTFMVKDVTGDEKPDMILFKKDGSKVVFDLADGKVK